MEETRINVTLRMPGNEVTKQMTLEHDIYFEPEHTLQVYAEAAWSHGAITETKDALDAATASAQRQETQEV